MRSASQIAEYILSFFDKCGKKIDNLKLQRVLYFVWLDYHKKTKQWLYCDIIKAGKLGPLIESVYNQYSHYVASSIYSFNHVDLNDDTLNIILEGYIDKPIGELVMKAREIGSPWEKAIKAGRYYVSYNDMIRISR